MPSPQLAKFKIPVIDNEPIFCKSYAPGSTERNTQMEEELPFEMPCVVNAKPCKVSVPAHTCDHPGTRKEAELDAVAELWKDIATNMDKYKGYPRIVGKLEKDRQKCSALSWLYVSSSIWTGGFKDLLLDEISKIKVRDWGNFMGPVIGRQAFNKIMSYIQKAKDLEAEILIGGMIIVVEEIFVPVITYTCFKMRNMRYGLTGAIPNLLVPNTSFASEYKALITASNALRNAAGNVYYNEKCTGAVVGSGQQPFGGAHARGTNDKAASSWILYRFVNARSIKENFVGVEAIAH
ncbi:Aldehyde/histidinol dehydrogenase [Rhodocollybia butyracea]|uniref:Aldehyde/histidinol dehydrogenase n=1 Tax=Rhodocollybia butyracea TaxID=206335 RepID=A0A9P5PCK7_9AGAR|nr:Aldehyde/histidinol dehydrogenase [Rhodocollybia butyracea]